MHRKALYAAIPLIALSGSAPLAQDLPSWRIAEICAQDSAVGQCRLYEAVARQEIAGSWQFLAKDWRESCLLTFKPPLEPSWRILSDCIEDEAKNAAAKRAAAEAEADRKRLAALNARSKAEAEAEAAAAKAAAEAAARRKAEARAAAEAAQRRAAAEAEAQRVAAAEARRRADAEKAAMMAAEAKRKTEAEKAAMMAAEAKRKADAEKAAMMAAEAKRKAEAAAEAKRKAEAAIRLAAAQTEAVRKQEAEAAARMAAAAAACQKKLSDIATAGNIKFETAGAKIAAEASGTLDALAEAAKTCPNGTITVEGHTDSRGTTDNNQALSQRRAEAVVNYLVGKGVPAGRLTPIGFGAAQPIATNDTPEGRAKNRRIQFSVK